MLVTFQQNCCSTPISPNLRHAFAFLLHNSNGNNEQRTTMKTVQHQEQSIASLASVLSHPVHLPFWPKPTVRPRYGKHSLLNYIFIKLVHDFPYNQHLIIMIMIRFFPASRTGKVRMLSGGRGNEQTTFSFGSRKPAYYTPPASTRLN